VYEHRTIRTNPYQPAQANQIFQRSTPVVSPPLFAVRTLGLGRIGLLNQWRMYTTGSGAAWLFDSQVLSKGAKGRPSDMGTILRNTYRWLAQPTVDQLIDLPAGQSIGGYITPAGHLTDPNTRNTVLKSYPEIHLSYDVKTLGNDPADPSLTLRRGVVGVRTTFSTGTDSVASIAQAARTNKLDFIIILEEFELEKQNGVTNHSAYWRLTNETLMSLAVACAASSSSDLMLFPGSVRPIITTVCFCSD
jgi:hypothetical protein